MGSQEGEATKLPEFRSPGNWEVIEVRKSGKAELPDLASPADWHAGALRKLGIPKCPGSRELGGRELGSGTSQISLPGFGEFNFPNSGATHLGMPGCRAHDVGKLGS